MSFSFLVVVLVLAGLVAVVYTSKQRKEVESQRQLEDAMADARRWTERLGGQVMNLTGTDTASQQALADAAERFSAANSALAQANSPAQAALARESALEGLYYINAAREIMGLTPGPQLPPLEGQKLAGKVTEEKTVDIEGQSLTASPHPSDRTPNYYPGGMVAGKPVPAGWYSRPWWADALSTGVWVLGYSMLFNAMFAGMAGVPAAAAEVGGVDGASDLDGGEALGGEALGGEGLGGEEAVAGGEAGFGAEGGDGGFFDGGFFGGGEGLSDGDGGGLFDFGFDF